MKQVLLKEGKAAVSEVPAPEVTPGTVLVRVDHSCISAGTEVSGLKAAGEPLWQRALKQPQKVKKALRMVAEQGIVATHDFVKNKVAAPHATGYSVAGLVIGVGEGIDDIEVGDRVACAGAQCAYHAEIVCVPRNLTVRVPDGLSFADACTVTLGAIALQGVRRANPTLGENFVVIGLGIIGQLVTQILKANGCQVIGTDLQEDRRDLALELGADHVLDPNSDVDIDQVARLTGGHGADGVIVTAATSSDEVMSTAFGMCRKKGRVVLVGDVGLNLKRSDFYVNELDFLISTSYGPGRYDGSYEEEGLDYPISYVRWTENRNMAAYLDLVDQGKVKVGPLIGRTFDIEDAGAAYESLASALFPPMALISYPAVAQDEAPLRKIANPRVLAPTKPGLVGMAVIGAGGFAKGTHLPNLRALKSLFSLEAVVSSTGHNATATAESFGARYASTDYDEVLADEAVNAVLICTPHDSHSSMTLAALQADKHVLVEKPLALGPQELAGIEEFYGSAGEAASAPLLLTGFNRRFSPFSLRIKELVAGRSARVLRVSKPRAWLLRGCAAGRAAVRWAPCVVPGNFMQS